MYLQLMAFMPITFHPLFRATIKTISLHKQLCQMRYILGTIVGSAFFLRQMFQLAYAVVYVPYLGQAPSKQSP